MKTIAITIDEDALKSIEKIARSSSPRSRSRSRIIRLAIKEYVLKEQRRAREAREREILKKHRVRLARQARALLSEQAKI